MQYESEHIEYKSQMVDDIYKEVIAFANTDGGVIYIGIDDQGHVTGIDNIDETYTRLTNGIRDAIHPDVTMFVRYVLQDNKVIRIEVGEGSYKPYYLKAKGMKPTGVYVRQGTTSVPASPEQIRQMIKESDGDNFEDDRCLDQDLTFEAAKAAFQQYGVEFSVGKYRALGITKNDVFTNLALLLSDQCLHTTKIAVFNDESCTEFRDSKEFGGSIFKQFENAINYLALCNRTVSTIKGVVRTDKQDYPEEAIREALLNALVHRDYSFSGSIIINVNDSKMEFISLGGLLPGLSTEDIRIGVSQPRNKKLAEIIHRSTTAELQAAFSAYLPGCAECDFYEMELGTAGMMRGYMARRCDPYFTLERKIRRYLSMSLSALQVPAQEREQVIAFVAEIDMLAQARKVVDAVLASLSVQFDLKG